MPRQMFVSLSTQGAINAIYNAVVKGSTTGELVDQYTLEGPGGTSCIVLVFEQYYYRVGNRLLLTVTIDDFMGRLRVSYVAGGGGRGTFLRFDWGAADRFSDVVGDVLRPYEIE